MACNRDFRLLCGLRFWLARISLLLAAASMAERAAFGQDPASVEKRKDVDLYGDALPEGAVARLGTLRFRTGGQHSFHGPSIAFIPGEQLLAGPGPNGGIGIWDPIHGNVLRELHSFGHVIERFAVSRDGSRIATLARRIVGGAREYGVLLQVWLPRTGELQNTIFWTETFAERSQQLAFAPDGRSIATGGSNGTLRFWDLATGQQLSSHQVAQGEVESLAFSPSWQSIAIASGREVAVGNWPQGDEPTSLLRREDGHRGAMSVTYSPDGRWLATGSDERRGIRIWDAATRRLQWRIDADFDGWFYPQRVEFTADSRLLAVPIGEQGHEAGRVELREIATGKVVSSYDADGMAIRHASISSDQQLVAGYGYQFTFFVWRIEDGEALEAKFVGHREPAYELAFTSDGRHVVSGGIDGTIRVWSEDGRPISQMRTDNRWVVGVAVSSDRQRIASLGFDQTLRVWDFDTGHELFNLPGHSRHGGANQNAVAFSSDGRLLSFGGNMYLRVWDMRTGKALAEHDIRPTGLAFNRLEDGEIDAPNDPFGGEGRIPFAIDSVLFTSDCEHLLLAAAGSIHAFDTDTGRETCRLELKGACRNFAMSPDGNKLASVEEQRVEGTRRYVTRLRDFATNKIVREISTANRTMRDICFSPSGIYLAIVESEDIGDGTRRHRHFICIYDIQTGEERGRIEASAQPARIVFSPDGSRLAASYDDTTVMLWDATRFAK